MSIRAIQAKQAGGPEALELVELPDPEPGPGELLVEVAAAGVNFIDTYRRSGVYPVPFPHTLGSEGAGRVLAVGPDTQGFSTGDAVAWAEAPGSYASQVVVRAANAIHVPDDVSLRTAAALPMQGLTAHYLVASTFPVRTGQDVLVHAAAGGVGLLLTQLATARGARVIGTVSTTEKDALARAAGASEVIRYTELEHLSTELPARVRAMTGGAGVHVVYDGVGKDTFDASLASLRARGMLVLFGGSSGQVPPLNPQRLSAAGSLYLTRPKIGDYVADRAELTWRADELFRAVGAGELLIRVGATFPLAEAAEAHRALESRRTTGKVLLTP